MDRKRATTVNRSTGNEKCLQMASSSGSTTARQQRSLNVAATQSDTINIRQRPFVQLSSPTISRLPSRQSFTTSIQQSASVQPATTTMNRVLSVQGAAINIRQRSSMQSATTNESRRSSVQNDTPIRQPRIAQSFHLIWLDTNIDESNQNNRNSMAQLRSVFSSIDTFIDADQCIEFLAQIQDDKVFMIVAGSIGECVVPDIHHLPQLDSIYVLCENKQRYEEWAKEWSKVKGIFIEMGSICELLKQAAQQYEQDAIPISFVSASDVSNENLDQLDQSFMYTQLIKELLLEIEYDEQSIKDLCAFCRNQYTENEHELKNIDKFEREYRLKSSIWWYTFESFLYATLNRSLRTQDVNIIIKMGFFIRDLHRQIEQLHSEQFGYDQKERTFIVYRGQSLSKNDFVKLTKSKGGLLSFNNFLSTSLSRDVSFNFTQNAIYNPESMGILFRMIIDPSISTTPFAHVGGVGHYQQEQEILFSMHTVFRIGEIQRIGNNNRLWEVELTLTGDNDQQLNILAERIREETFREEKGLYRLGMFLIRVGEFDLAEQLYRTLLEQSFEDGGKAPLLHQLGYISEDLGDYTTALQFYERSLEIKQKMLPPDHPSLGVVYGNIGSTYNEMGEYPKALSCYEKALEIFQKFFPPNHSQLATCYNNIGLVHYNMDQCSEAFSFYEKALQIDQKVLSPNDPDLAIVYNNMGLIYDKLGEYSKALSFYEDTLKIYQRTLPRNHSSLAIPYSNIGSVYNNMDEYSKALSFYQQALEIDEKKLSPYHAFLAMSHNNIGSVLKNMGEYSKALPFCERAVDIGQRSLPSDHPNLQLYKKNLEFVKIKLE